MKQKLTAICCCLVLLAIGCKKKPVESTWTINGEKHTSVASAAVGKAVAVLDNDDSYNGFKLIFSLSYLPVGDDKSEWTIAVDSVRQDPNVARLFFYVDDRSYHISFGNVTPLIASSNNGKAKYELAGAWFVNSSQDSIYVTATLNEP